MIIVFISSCTNNGTTAPPSSGTLIGSVSLYDDFGYTIHELSGVLITIEGTKPQLSDTTNQYGQFQFDSLPTGTYNVIFSKAGFATYKKFGFSFTGGDMPGYLEGVELSKPSSVVVTSISYDIVTGYMKLTVDSTSQNKPNIYIRTFFSTDKNVSSTNYQSTGIGQYQRSDPVRKILVLPDSHVFPSGTTVYMIAYGMSFFDLGYWDPSTNLTFFPALNPQGSNIVSFVMD